MICRRSAFSFVHNVADVCCEEHYSNKNDAIIGPRELAALLRKYNIFSSLSHRAITRTVKEFARSLIRESG